MLTLKLQIEKLNRDRYGPRSERTARLLDLLELALEELETAATEDELAAEMAAAKTTKVASFTRKRPFRKPFPDHLPRERVIVPGPVACSCCGGSRLSRLGEDITETLEVIPKSWKVIQHVREKFSCRDCEKISQAPAPFHVIARGWAGPSLLAMVLFEKFGQHQPLNRQAERYARRWSPIWRPGCVSSAPNSRAATMSPRPWTTCSSAGSRLRASSTMAASVCPTMPPSAACAVSPWGENPGCSGLRP
jgi:transposase